MTTYTADDFKNARFATHSDGRIAARLIGGKPFCPSWILQAVGGVAHRSDHVMAQEGWVPLGENPRPLTADDYQRGEMAALAAFVGPKLSIPIDALVRAIVNEVLTPPPSRPEGAGEIEATLFEWNQMDDNGNYALDPEIITELADHLARSFPVGSES